MNELLALIARYGAVIEWDTGDDQLPKCGEHPDDFGPTAVAEVLSVDVALHACAKCLPGALRTALEVARDAGDHNPRVTVTVNQAAGLAVAA